MKLNKNDKVCGIYCIKNKINNKVYIGKSKNIYRRITQHLYDLKNKRKKNENSHFLNAWYKYGRGNFEYSILEELKLDNDICKERELYWIKKYNSIDRRFGYNLRMDSSSQMIVHQETSKKISKRLKKEWREGIRKNHGEKLSNNWKNNPSRSKNQSKMFTDTLTKYEYYIYDLEFNFIKNVLYKELKNMGLKNVIANFHKNKKDLCKHKNYFIKRIKV